MVNNAQDGSEHPLPKPDDSPTAKQWEFYHAIITELYVKAARDLNEVVETMKSTYDFKAR